MCCGKCTVAAVCFISSDSNLLLQHRCTSIFVVKFLFLETWVLSPKTRRNHRYMLTYMYISWILKYIFLTRKSMNFDFPAFTQSSSKNDIGCWWYSLNISTHVHEDLCLFATCLIISCIHINTMKTTRSWGLQAWLHLLGAVSSGMLSVCNPLSI